jgi:hypothetical protein
MIEYRWKSHLMEGHLMQQKRKGYIMQQDHLMLMVLSATYCTCISLSYCPSSGCIPHYRKSKEQAFSHLLGELSPSAI